MQAGGSVDRKLHAWTRFTVLPGEERRGVSQSFPVKTKQHLFTGVLTAGTRGEALHANPGARGQHFGALSLDLIPKCLHPESLRRAEGDKETGGPLEI